jgi:hypothetical protein
MQNRIFYLLASLGLSTAMVFSFTTVSLAKSNNSNGNGNSNKNFHVTVQNQPSVASSFGVQSENEPSSIDKSNNLKNLIKTGDRLINQRVNSLNSLKKKIDGNSKLTASQKASLDTEIASQITALQTLKSKIDADTDLITAKADVKSIYTDFRIYAVELPKLKMTLTADLEQNYLDMLNTTTFPNVQTAINNARAAGQNVTARQTALDNAKTIAATVQPQITSVLSSLSTLKPSDYPTTSKSVLTSVQTTLKQIHTEFKKIFTNLSKAR